jgi:hypothetical protein
MSCWVTPVILRRAVDAATDTSLPPPLNLASEHLVFSPAIALLCVLACHDNGDPFAHPFGAHFFDRIHS